MKTVLLGVMCLLSSAMVSAFEEEPVGDGVGDSYSYFPLTAGSQWTYDTRLGRITALVGAGSDDGAVIYQLSSSFGISYEFVFGVNDDQIQNPQRSISALLWRTDYEFVPAVIMLDFPMSEGKLWQWSGQRLESRRNTQAVVSGTVLGEETIEIGENDYDCLVVSIVYADDDANSEELRMWLAPGVGMVKGTITMEGSGVLGVISRIIGSELQLNLLDYTVH